MTLVLGALGTSIGMKRALDANAEVMDKNRELDRQKLALVDYKERLSGLLESNQRMLGEIRGMNAGGAQLPTEFEALRNENQALLDKVKNLKKLWMDLLKKYEKIFKKHLIMMILKKKKL